ncbi:MAG: DUF1489 domain-containing protein [Rhizobiales bacterium]|nr:DUF1489 domain-containing protein [Hyphomicrobiales bacterium]
MPLHLLKLCVGAESIADLESWIGERMRAAKKAGRPPEQIHTTRMVPKRIAELTDGGSLYWVIKGQVACRQELIDIRPFTDADGISRCHLVMQPAVTAVSPRPCRPFQGWRYLPDADKPRDLSAGDADVSHFPEPLRRELRELGLI